MKLEKTKIDFADERGVIRDILVVPKVGITYISSKKGTVRGNHYHKKTMQYEYVLSGSFEYYCKDVEGGRKIKKKVVSGDLLHIFPNEIHTFEALEDSEILSFNFGPSKGKDNHKDTFKAPKPLA